ncbi:hypothetical protein PIB30_046392 [Stylosanthes scabra]|uniref:Uncharacterized protein n=1 Tax=Stylosanthes scabra TaxID=79078 RepID=A0ABU6RGH1_9FABA|nr:hypothetical protein [Stylosanthes scabra]
MEFPILQPLLDEVEKVSVFFCFVPVLLVILAIRVSVPSVCILYGSWCWNPFDLRHLVQKLSEGHVEGVVVRAVGLLLPPPSIILEVILPGIIFLVPVGFYGSLAFLLLQVVMKSFLDLLHRLWWPFSQTFQKRCASLSPLTKAIKAACDLVLRSITPESLYRFLHQRVQVQAGFWKSPTGCEVLHEAVSQVGEAFNAIRWEGIELCQGVFLHGYGKGFALYGVRSVYEQHPVFEGIQVMLQVCSPVVGLDLDRVSKLLRKLFC